VIEAGREFKVLADNLLAEGFMASPALAGNALVVRTRTHLYRIEEAPAPKKDPAIQ
jgi:outer membrane protein assembly factor BamB